MPSDVGIFGSLGMIKKFGKGANVPLLPPPQQEKKKGEGGQSYKALKLSEFYFSFVYSSGAINFDLKL